MLLGGTGPSAVTRGGSLKWKATNVSGNKMKIIIVSDHYNEHYP